MKYAIGGQILVAIAGGYLIETEFTKILGAATAAPEGLALSADHRTVFECLQDQYREHGRRPNFRTMRKDVDELTGGCGSKRLYDLFPSVPPSSACAPPASQNRPIMLATESLRCAP
jgi:tRNA 2-thiouridine synthesizing protein E